MRRVQVVTRKMPNVQGRHLDEPGLQDPTYYGASPTIVAEPGRPIEGVVKDADTKAPIPGAIVTAQQLSGSIMSIEGLITATTDAEGRYRLIGLPKGDTHVLSVHPPLDQPYFVTDFLKVSAGPGIEPVRFDIAAHRGIWIDGRVTDAKTGQPVRAIIHYYPYLANTQAQTFPNFRANSMSANWTGNRYHTDDQGRFRVVGIPGRGIVAVKSLARSYQLGVGGDRLSERPRRGNRMRRDGIADVQPDEPAGLRGGRGGRYPGGCDRDAPGLRTRAESLPTIQLFGPRGKPLTHVTRVRTVQRQQTGDPTSTTRARPRSTASTPRRPRPCSSCTATASLGPSCRSSPASRPAPASQGDPASVRDGHRPDRRRRGQAGHRRDLGPA